MTDATRRFSNRADNYAKYRPGYPAAVIKLLQSSGNLQPGSPVADIGSGTGIFTRLLLDEGYTVCAVEPNEAMRQVANMELGMNKNFRSVNGIAEATNLPDHSVDLIVCAQAFHWFNTPKTKAEFQRILKPGGKVSLIWNNRQVEADAFSIGYELLLQQEGTDYKRVNHQNLTEADFVAFFKNGKYQLNCFPNTQDFDEIGLIGRASSSSYVPTSDTPQGEQFIRDLKQLFSDYQVDGKVRISYQTEVYLGEI